jgi:hypothetical protein
MIAVANFCSHISVANICSPKVGIAKGIAIAKGKARAKGKAPAVERAKGKAIETAVV